MVTERELVRLKAVEAASAELLRAWAARPFDPRKTREIRAKLATLVLPAAPPVKARRLSRAQRVQGVEARLPYSE